MIDITALPTALLIDDDPSIHDLMRFLLADLARVVSATNGLTGIEMALTQRPDVILLDISMPEMDGFEVCRRLGQEIGVSTIPILFITAGNNHGSEIKALTSGGVDFIGKPFQPEIVRARIATHVKLRQATLALQTLAHRDGLTGLYNRRFFDERFATEIARHRRKSSSLGFALIDVDHFKLYNDSLGHYTGDECLREIASQLQQSTRRPDETVFRYGGEEFGVILPECDVEAAGRYGSWICNQIRQLNITHPGIESQIVTISVGIIAITPSTDTTARFLIDLADTALYKAKKNGRNQFSIAQ